MKSNMGNVDRWVRIVLGLGLVASALFSHFVWGWVGIVLLATAAVRYCPLYLPFGIHTEKGSSKA